eukprot:Lithocolla_globosa_v1_NODE_1570_length_2479_cov_19.554043.p2 type:complete len:120 gc:universal NODE_1570_length_2479_cov_19.554043:1483-1124(-)
MFLRSFGSIKLHTHTTKLFPSIHNIFRKICFCQCKYSNLYPFLEFPSNKRLVMFCDVIIQALSKSRKVQITNEESNSLLCFCCNQRHCNFSQMFDTTEWIHVETFTCNNGWHVQFQFSD